MKIPRDLSGNDLIKLLKKYGFEVTRQSGSHIRISTQKGGEFHIKIPQSFSPKNWHFISYTF